MAWLRAFGGYLPSRIVDNQELGSMVAADPEWILNACGIEQRRFAAPEDTVASLGIMAARDCLERAGMTARDIGFILVASGSAERRFPGPAAAIGAGLGITGVPAIDLPLASAGSLFAMSLASGLAAEHRNVLVVGSEIMTRVLRFDAAGRDTAILFGDGAGACIVSSETGFASIAGSLLASDGDFANALALEFGAPLHMEGRTIIMHASRKIPRAITELLERHNVKEDEVGTFLLHQANLNLLERVAQTLAVPFDRFYCNIARYGNTSSASLLIAAAEWWCESPLVDRPLVFAAFGAGLNWGALLAEPTV